MANKKISELTSGEILRPSDEIAINRSGSTKKVTLDNISPLSNRVAVIGTSLVQQNDVGITSNNRISHSNIGWIHWLRAHSKGLIDYPIWYDEAVIVGWEPSGVPATSRNFNGLNFGVSGQVCSEIIARLPYIESNFINQFSDIIIDAGTNDVPLDTKEAIQTNRETIAQFFLDRGKRVHFLPILSRDTSVSSWGSGTAPRKKAHWINQKTIEFCNKTNNCFFLNWNKPWVDGTDADGNPRTNFSSDGTHFNNTGAEEVGIFMKEHFEKILSPQINNVISNDDVYDATDNPLGCIVPNPLMDGTAGAKTGANVSGDVATGYRMEQRDAGTTTVVCSKEAKAEDQGYYQVLSFDNIDATSQEFYFRTNSANVPHTLAEKWVQLQAEIITNDSDAIENISLLLDDNDGTDGNYSEDMYLVGDQKWLPKNRDILLKTPPILLKADAANMRVRVVIWIKGTAATLPVIKIGSFELRQIASPVF